MQRVRKSSKSRFSPSTFVILGALLGSWPATARAGTCTKNVTPTQSIQTALNGAVPGDVICVAPGTYHETLTISASGTAAQPIVLRGEGGRPILDGQYQLPAPTAMNGLVPAGCPMMIDATDQNNHVSMQTLECSVALAMIYITGSYIDLEGFEIYQSLGRGIVTQGQNGGTLTNLTLRNNYIHSTRSSGVNFGATVNSVFENNEVADTGNNAPFVRTAAEANWGSGVGTYASHFITFQQNIIHDNWNDALLTDLSVGGSTDMTIQDNVFYDNYADDVYLTGISNVVVQRNLHYCTNRVNPLEPTITYVSIRIAPTESEFPQNINSTNITVKNNVIAGCSGTKAINYWNTVPGTRTVSGPGSSNNTFYADKDSIDITGTPATGFLQNVAVDANLIVETPFTAPVGATAAQNQVSSSSVDGGLAGTDGQGSFPPYFSACQVKASWFQNLDGTAVGADVSTFGTAGLLAPLPAGSCSASNVATGCADDAGACDASAPTDADSDAGSARDDAGCAGCGGSAPAGDAGTPHGAGGGTSGKTGNGGGCSASGSVTGGALGIGVLPFLAFSALRRRRRGPSPSPASERG